MAIVEFPSSMSREQALLALWMSAQCLGPLSKGGMADFHSLLGREISIVLRPSLSFTQDYLSDSKYVDYFKGKPIKTNFSDYPYLDSRMYNQYHGKNAMELVCEYCQEYEFDDSLFGEESRTKNNVKDAPKTKKNNFWSKLKSAFRSKKK